MLKEKDLKLIAKNILTICRIVYSHIELNNLIFELWSNILKLEKNNIVIVTIINYILSNQLNLNFIAEMKKKWGLGIGPNPQSPLNILNNFILN